MKKLSLPLMLLMFGAAEAKSIQNPIWYSISEKILAEAQELIAPAEAKASKKLKPKTTVNKSVLRCVDKKKEIVLPTPEISLPANGI